MTTHRLAATEATTVDVYSRDHVPVLTVQPGDRLVVESLDASGHLQRQTFPGEVRPRMFAEARGHCLTGPIEVAGARAGDMLALRLVSMRPGPWGWTVAAAKPSPVTERLGLLDAGPSWLLWEIDADAGTATADRGFVRRLAPFLGVLGVAPAEPGEHRTTPPRPGVGGNIDCRELTAGATLFLPVAVDGALLYLGDGHAAQGDGEVGGTAIECPMTTELVVDVLGAGSEGPVGSGRPVPGVHAETLAGRITFGFSTDLNEAMGDALAAMVDWLEQLLELDRGTALAFASTAVDLRVTQVANETWGVHALLPPDIVA